MECAPLNVNAETLLGKAPRYRMAWLPAALFAVLWLWSDSIGNLLSVISTYFYFGWEGVPGRVPKIFGIALLAFSAPVIYRLGFWRRDALPGRQLSQLLLLAFFALYLGLSLYRQSDVFAWGSVLLVWLGGLLMMRLLHSLGQTALGEVPGFVVLLSFFFYLSVRVSQGGLPLLLSPPALKSLIGWSTLTVFVVAALLLPERLLPDKSPAGEAQTLPRGSSLLGLVFGLLMGLSVGLIYNLHIWSAQQPEYPAGLFFLSLGLGTLLAWGLPRKVPQLLVLLLAAGGVAVTLYTLLYTAYGLSTGLLAHGAGALGLGSFWLAFVKHWQQFQARQPNYFPALSLQLGFIGLLLILALFLLQANPNGFWLAWLLASAVLLWLGQAQAAENTVSPPALQRLWVFACSLFSLMGLLALLMGNEGLLPTPAESAPDKSTPLKVMSSNIRYGWTDDYRFDPRPHLKWLQAQDVDLLGLQEVNKGHTSGAYSDLFRFYQRGLPGDWFYGDAHYGFGNALRSRLPVDKLERRHYQAKDMLRRAALVATVRHADRPIDVFVTHLSHLPPPNPVRTDQLRELASWLQASPHPWIVLADLNTSAESGELDALLALAHPVFRERPEWLLQPSYPAQHPSERIDFVIFSPHFELQEHAIADIGANSDHRPVSASLLLP